MKNFFSLLFLGALSLGLGSLSLEAQGFGANSGGSNPFGRVYAPPANPQQPVATPEMANPQGPGMYNGGGMAPGNSYAYSNEPIDPNHKLNSGDQLSFQVVEDRDDKAQFLAVTASGEVNIPLVGLMPASGKSVSQFTSEVKARLERDYYYHATVMMGLSTVAQRQSRGRVYVTGAVHNVGPVELPLDEKLTASKAIIKAGGPKDIANLRKIRVLNKDGVDRGLTVDFKDALRGKPKTDVTLEPGDTVFVPERTILF